MAQRHNEFGRLLGTVENGVSMPLANVPHLNDIAASLEQDAQYHLENMQQHADELRKLGTMQPDFGDVQSEA